MKIINNSLEHSYETEKGSLLWWESNLKPLICQMSALKLYSKAIGLLSKGYLPISLLPPSKLEKILKEVRIAIAKSNKDYDLVLTRLYLYYDMKLVMFGIDN